MAPLHRGVLWHIVSPSPIGAPERVSLAQVERGGGERTGIVAPYTYHGDCLCWLMATYVAHTSHYEAVLGASRPVTYSPWPGHRRVMANALWIKCILSLTARWHRCLDASAISRLRHSLSSLPPLLCSLFVSVGYFLVACSSSSRISIAIFWGTKEHFAIRPSLQQSPMQCCIFLCQTVIIWFENIDENWRTVIQ